MEDTFLHFLASMIVNAAHMNGLVQTELAWRVVQDRIHDSKLG